MTEEEKKAIEIIKEILEDPFIYFSQDSSLKDNENRAKAIEILLKLVEKQKKEIERQGNTREIEEKYVEENYISKDKIRELFKGLYTIEESKYAKMKTIDSDKAFKFVKDVEKLVEEE